MYGTETRYQPKGKAHDALEAIYFSGFEGSFEDLIKTITKLEQTVRERFIEHESMRSGRYCTGSELRSVKYDRVWLEIGSDYDGERELQVWGERDQHDDERAYLREAKKRRSEEEEETQRASYKRLKKKYEKGAT
jgi:hypothetical protein